MLHTLKEFHPHADKTFLTSSLGGVLHLVGSLSRANFWHWNGRHQHHGKHPIFGGGPSAGFGGGGGGRGVEAPASKVTDCPTSDAS